MTQTCVENGTFIKTPLSTVGSTTTTTKKYHKCVVSARRDGKVCSDPVLPINNG
jgi:hypothetical protein